MQRVIIVGFGFMGSMHAQVYAALPQVQIVGVVNDKGARAEQTLAGLGIAAPVFSTLDEALAAAPADFIDICVQTDLHAAFAHKAIAAGKHFFCEKPLALNLADAESIVRAAAEAKVRAQVGHCIRFWPEYQALEALIAAGTAGRLLSLTLQRRAARPGYSDANWLNHEKKSGGAALDLHIHDTDFVHHLLGRPEAVTSQGTFDHGGCSHIFTTYHFPNLLVSAEGGWNYPPNWGFQMAFQAVFENGAVEFDSRAQPSLMATFGEDKPAPLPFAATSVAESATNTGNISALSGYFNELEYFVNCLESGTEPKLGTLRQAAESVQTVLLEIESAGRNVTVALPKTAPV